MVYPIVYPCHMVVENSGLVLVAVQGAPRFPFFLWGLQRVPRAVAMVRRFSSSGYCLGWKIRFSGHAPSAGAWSTDAGPMHGVKEAADGSQAVQHKIPAGVVPIRWHRAAGTCDAYCERGCDWILFTIIGSFHIPKAERLEQSKFQHCQPLD